LNFCRCCSIDNKRHTLENFQSFKAKYPETCGEINFIDAKPCIPFIRNQRNFTIFLCCIMMILRLITLILLWIYIRDEYSGYIEEPMDISDMNGERSTATFTA
jgi:hypothetical protein